ncbi:MAG: GGDEF domain-containing protein, partial [Bacillota bacterium]
ILNNYSTMLMLPLFQYLLRYGRRVALHYVWASVAAIIYICVVYYKIHPENHFVVVAVMFLIAYNEGLLVQENMDLRKQLLNLAIYDELTGLYNFRFFTQAMEREISRSKRYGHPLTVLLIDIDYFKKINDSYGHQKGNQVLKGLAEIIQESVRDCDYAARYGGEEFVIILPQASLEQGHMVAERIRESIAGQRFDFGTVTVSIGVACCDPVLLCRDDLIKRADMVLYSAKKNGRNRVEVDSGVPA